MPTINSLGEHTVRYGTRGDPDRIKKMVGGFKHYLSPALGPSLFVPDENDPDKWRSRVGIAGWPEGEKPLELFAVNFGRRLPNYAAVFEEAVSFANGDYKMGGFPHLVTQCSAERTDILYRMGIEWLEAPDMNSLCRDDPGVLGAPDLRPTPSYGGLGAHAVEHKRSPNVWFLFYKE